jgi:FMN phosphatase YigB (HAD superfamily)
MNHDEGKEPRAMRRPVLIFDFGNVVAHFDYTRAFAPLAARLGTTGAALLEQVRGAGLSRLMNRYESGALTDREFVRAACGLVPQLDTLPFDDFVSSWRDIFWLNEPVVRLVADLKRQGYTLLLGSNTNALHADDFRVRYADALAPFDRLVLSYQVGAVKPAAGFFHACAEAARTTPAACVFIDDLPENIAGAQAAGMTGIVYRDYPGLLEALAGLGVAHPAPGGIP